MPDRFLPLAETLAPEAVTRHNRVRERYEAAVRAGTPPRIEDLLPEVPADERPALLAALVRVDADLRPTPIPAADYKARFPEFGPLIDTLFKSRSDDTSHAPTTPPVVPPPAVPGYEVGPRVLGDGGMGVVFEARHAIIGLRAAVKTMKGQARPVDLVRFEREAKAVAALDHPHVVRVYDYGHDAGRPYFVMEFVAGGSLAAKLDGRPLDPRAAAAVVEPVARAMAAVHAAGIVHRDLKPANVLLAADGTPKVADFGLAKPFDPVDPAGPTHPYDTLGTASYMAPEQVGGAKAVGPPADVWGLGAILFECLTGRPPFRADTLIDTLFQVREADPPRPASLAPGVPDDLEEICLKCLRKDPADRYPSATAVADELRRYLDGIPVEVQPLSPLEADARWAARVGFQLGDPLGAGRWAFVYEAVQRNIGRRVVLKLATGTVGSRSHAALRRQADAMAGLSHPNLLHLYDYAEAFGRPYLVMEYVHGGLSLSARLGETAITRDGGLTRVDTVGRPLSPGGAAETARRLALAVQSVHDRGYLHCGLSAGDVVLTAADDPKLGGFGAARRLSRPDDPDVPAPEWVRPNSLPPEVLTGRWADLSPATDVYSLGAVLYEMLTAVPPFAAESLADAREWAINRSPDPPSRLNPAVPSALDAIVLRCLAKEPGQRYSTAAGLAAALELYGKTPSGNDATVTVDPVLPATPMPTADQFYQLRLEKAPKGELVGQVFPLSRHRTTIGRSEECVIHLPDPGANVSRVHCGVLWDAALGQHLLLDYGSRNGCTVNLQRVAAGSVALAPGDRIRVCDFGFVFEPTDPAV